MPAGVVRTPEEERLWDKAKRQAAKQGRAGDYAYIMGIFKQMTGRKSMAPEVGNSLHKSTAPKLGKSFVIAPAFRQARIGGQVPRRSQRFDDQAAAVGALLQKPPPVTAAMLLDHTEPRMTPRSVVSNLGLDQAAEESWRRFVEETLGSTDSEVTARQKLYAKIQEQRLGPELGRALAQRVMSYWRGMRKSTVRVLTADELLKAIGHKYIRRVPKPGGGYRYYYRESAVAREATAGEEIKLGRRTAKVLEVGKDGTLAIELDGQHRRVSPNEWHDLLTRHYGRAFSRSAEHRARQTINAVLRHVLRQLLEDLRGTTDEERLAELEKRVPAIYAKLQAAFRRAGLSPFAAKRVLSRTLERRGWEVEARALVIGSVIRFREPGTRELIDASENLAGGKLKLIKTDPERPVVIPFCYEELSATVDSFFKRLSAVESRCSEKRAADSLSEDLLRAHTNKQAPPVMLLFDEIERISPGTASSEHWRVGDDFVYFWQTMRGFFQRNPSVYTYMLVGTNPSCVEAAMVGDHENPLFASIPPQYVPCFTVEQVRDMVRKLRRNMGMQFNELIYLQLTDDFGGHPFLIRQMCSALHNNCKGDRPAKIDKALYKKIKTNFLKYAGPYLNMILQVLEEWYPDEHEMLSLLALGDDKTFNEYAAAHDEYTRHLIGYGILERGEAGYSFKIEAIKQHVQVKNKYERLNLTQEEMRAETSARRNKLEKNLRSVIRRALQQSLGREKATHEVLSAIPEERRKKLSNRPLAELLHPDSSPLYILDLQNIIRRNWSVFQNIFEKQEKDRILQMLQDINDVGRPDAHAKEIKSDDFTQLRLHDKRIEPLLEDWL